MKAGIDFGTSLVKTAWMTGADADENKYQFSSTADFSLEEIAEQLHKSGVTQINAVGIRCSDEKLDYFEDFQIVRPEGDLIESEVRLQAEGARRLLRNEGHKGYKFLLVSIGTGTSYTIVNYDRVTKFQLGNSLGGGFIQGLGKVLGEEDYNELASKAMQGVPLDLRIKDIIPEKAGTFEGELVIANFGKGTSGSERPSAYATVISTVAVAIIRDVMLLGMIQDLQLSNDVVYVGSTVSFTPLLKELLQLYSSAIGKNPIFPEHGEYALAIGAYHMPQLQK